jgi:tetratricopeptide (TPR) repeat protein
MRTPHRGRASCAACAALLLVAAPLCFPQSDAPPGGSPTAKLVEQGFDHFYNLEYEQAIADFERAIAADPDSPDLHNHLAEAIVFQEMFRNGALESELVSGTNSFLRRPKLNPSPETERRFLNEVARAMELAGASLKENPNDTAAMYAMGISYGLRSNYFWVVKKSWRDSLRDATAAGRMHTRITELDPANVDARLVQGLHDYVVGSLPWSWRALGFLVGIRGDKERGIHTIQDVAAHGNRNRIDAKIFLCALYRRENQPRKAIPEIQDLIRRFPRNYLLRLELSQMYSMAGDKEHALAALDEAAELKRRHAPGLDRLSWEKIWFHQGVIQFWYRDLDHALENLKKVTAAGDEVDLSTGVTAWLRLGQTYDMKHQRVDALNAYRKAIEYAPQAEAAQESRKYLATPYRR